jgi:A/G-specific adenine glycosylase
VTRLSLLKPAHIRKFQKTVYDYHRKYGRILPWRKTADPYKILVSEVMLQQTQVSRVIDRYQQFINTFPTIKFVASSSLHEILFVWKGLGYNRRAHSLKRLAEIIVTEYNSRIPSDFELLVNLPGIGKATANAILAFAFKKPVVFIETNIRTVYIVHFFDGRKSVDDNEIYPMVAQSLDMQKPKEWYSALMDYGVFLKKKFSNPSRKSTHYKKQSPFKGSNRQVRGKIIRILVEEGRLTEKQLLERVTFREEMVRKNMRKLKGEGLIIKKGKYIIIG